MIRKCFASDFERIYEIINDGAQAYKGVIPEEYWKEPYMSRDELRSELEEGIEIWGYEDNGEIIGVMGYKGVCNLFIIFIKLLNIEFLHSVSNIIQPDCHENNTYSLLLRNQRC